MILKLHIPLELLWKKHFTLLMFVDENLFPDDIEVINSDTTAVMYLGSFHCNVSQGVMW